jgi:hypothetical protein
MNKQQIKNLIWFVKQELRNPGFKYVRFKAWLVLLKNGFKYYVIEGGV